MEVNHKYSIDESVYHRIGDDISYGEVVGYEDDCYVIKTPVHDVFAYMRLTDEDVSKNYEELKN